MKFKLNLAILNKKNAKISLERMKQVKAGLRDETDGGDDEDHILNLIYACHLCDDWCTVTGDDNGEYNDFVDSVRPK